MENIFLSAYGQGSTLASPVNRMMAAFADDFREGVDINLGVGYVSDRTIPHDWIEEALHEVIAYPQEHKAAFNYGGPGGSANLIAAIRRFYVDHRIGGLSRDLLEHKRIVVGASGMTSLLKSISEVLPRGLVITTDPIYYIYCDLLRRAGFTLMTVPEDEQGMDVDHLEQRLDELGDRKQQISFVYVVTINNPTGTILSNARRCRLVQIIMDLSHAVGHKVPLLLDTAYELLVHDPDVPRPESALLYDGAGIVYELGTLSKILAPTLRIGFMIGSHDPFVDAVVQNVSDTGFSAPLLSQEVAARILDKHATEQLARVNAHYREKGVMVRQWIDTYLGPYLREVRGGQAGFYFYLTFADFETVEGSTFFKYLTRTTANPVINGAPPQLNQHVLYMPGQFCVHPDGDLAQLGRRQLRLSYGFESLPQIQRALELMGKAATHAVAGQEGYRRA